MTIEEHKKFQKKSMKWHYILIIVWGVFFILNLIMCLLIEDVHPISWICTGLFLGGCIIMLFEIFHKKTRNKYELFLLDIIYNEYFKLLYELKKTKEHSIQVKGGKKRKNGVK